MHFPFPSASANFTIVSRPRKVGRASNFPGTTPRSAGPTCNGLLDQTPSPLTTPLFFPIYLRALILSLFSSTRRIIKFIFQLLLLLFFLLNWIFKIILDTSAFKISLSPIKRSHFTSRRGSSPHRGFDFVLILLKANEKSLFHPSTSASNVLLESAKAIVTTACSLTSDPTAIDQRYLPSIVFSYPSLSAERERILR